MNVGQVDYTSSAAPDLYRCTDCLTCCRLWRKYGSYPKALKCLDCCGAKLGDIGPRGELTAGDMVPAIPTDDGSTFWGFWSAPREAKEWWSRMPTMPAPPCPEGGDAASWAEYVADVGPIRTVEPHVALDIEVGEEP